MPGEGGSGLPGPLAWALQSYPTLPRDARDSGEQLWELSIGTHPRWVLGPPPASCNHTATLRGPADVMSLDTHTPASPPAPGSFVHPKAALLPLLSCSHRLQGPWVSPDFTNLCPRPPPPTSNLVPDPHIPSPLGSPPPPVPQALYVKTVPGFLPQWLMPPTTPYPGAILDSSPGQRLLQT